MPGLTRKQTAWKKSRKFGDVKGGRMRLKVADGILHRFHSLQRPAQGEKLPIVMLENPSRDFYFPVTPEQVLDALDHLPSNDVHGLTHLWFRGIKKLDWEKGSHPWAWFICGSGVRVVVLYPMPTSRRICLGRRPEGRQLRWLQRWTGKLEFTESRWWMVFDEKELEKLYMEGLLLHEIGHHVDEYRRRWSSANRKQCEAFAEQYAVQWSTSGTFVWKAADSP